MKAMFVGDPNDNFSGAETITVYGETFTKGKWKEVGSNRFATHSHFLTDADEDGAPGPTEDELKANLDALGVRYNSRAGAGKLAELLAAEQARCADELATAKAVVDARGANPDQADDEDGEDGPSASELRADLDKLGVKYHPRTGRARLAELLAEARDDTGAYRVWTANGDDTEAGA